MTRVLYIGDPHVRVEDLDDCSRLVEFVAKVAADKKVDRVVFLGDQHNNHALVHVEVTAFWHNRLRTIPGPVFMLVGNHDQPGDASSKAHALLSYKDMPGVKVIDEPAVVDGILHLPYYHSSQEFIDVCREYSHCRTVVCHQTFTGAQYENGFYAKDGVAPEDIPQEFVLSGHIHSPQAFGKVEYLGSPRWLTASDANDDRFVTIVRHEVGASALEERISTVGVCRRVLHFEDTPDKPAEPPPGDDRLFVDIVGPAEWIDARRAVWAGRARVRTQRTDVAAVKLRESEGIDRALRRYLEVFKPEFGTNRDKLEEMINDRLRP